MKSNSAWLVAFVGAAVVAWLAWERHQLSQRIAALESELTATKTSRRDAMPILPSETSARPDAQPSRESGAVSSSEDSLHDWTAEVRRRWAMPAVNAERLNAAVVRIEAKYGRWIGSLKGWPPEEIENLKHLLAANELAIHEAALLRKFPPSLDDVNAQRSAVTRAMEENQARLQRALGDEMYSNFRDFERARAYQPQVSGIVNALRSRGMEMTDGMEENLLLAYSAAIHDAAQAASSQGQNETASSPHDQHGELQKHLLRRLSPLLDEQQLAAFLASHLEQEGER